MPLPGQAAPRVLAVVPARYASTRFPGKPLVELAGVPMIVRVLERAALASSISEVIAATDDERIARVVRGVGRRVVMTSEACQSGTDRVAEAVRTLAFDGELVVNVQGDEPLLDPADLDALVVRTLASGADLGTLARPLDEAEGFENPNVVKVVRTQGGRALYFSRAPIPYGGAAAALRHIGLYAYRPDALQKLAALEPSALERLERLEQLRALEHGLSIAVIDAPSTRLSVAVDTPADAARVIAILTEKR